MTTRRSLSFRLGMAGYTYHKFKLDETLAALKSFDVHDLCVKDFHLPPVARTVREGIGPLRKVRHQVRDPQPRTQPGNGRARTLRRAP